MFFKIALIIWIITQLLRFPKIGYRFETHLKLIFHEISFVHKLFLSCVITLKLYNIFLGSDVLPCAAYTSLDWVIIGLDNGIILVRRQAII